MITYNCCWLFLLADCYALVSVLTQCSPAYCLRTVCLLTACLLVTYLLTAYWLNDYLFSACLLNACLFLIFVKRIYAYRLMLAGKRPILLRIKYTILNIHR